MVMPRQSNSNIFIFLNFNIALTSWPTEWVNRMVNRTSVPLQYYWTIRSRILRLIVNLFQGNFTIFHRCFRYWWSWLISVRNVPKWRRNFAIFNMYFDIESPFHFGNCKSVFFETFPKHSFAIIRKRRQTSVTVHRSKSSKYWNTSKRQSSFKAITGVASSESISISQKYSYYRTLKKLFLFVNSVLKFAN